jgi:hypothetical protein
LRAEDVDFLPNPTSEERHHQIVYRFVIAYLLLLFEAHQYLVADNSLRSILPGSKKKMDLVLGLKRFAPHVWLETIVSFVKIKADIMARESQVRLLCPFVLFALLNNLSLTSL